MTIATLDIKENKILIGFALFKYMNSESYKRILKIINDNFQFNPYALNKAINETAFFKKTNSFKMFFPFCKVNQRKKISSSKKGLTKLGANILSNIELLLFINVEKIDNYKIFSVDEIRKLEGYESLIKYLNNFWFKKNNNNYNYSNL